MISWSTMLELAAVLILRKYKLFDVRSLSSPIHPHKGSISEVHQMISWSTMLELAAVLKFGQFSSK